MEEDERPEEPVILPCSGASDTGEIADGAARGLTRSGITKMYCLAGLGTRVEEVVAKLERASRIVALDGCENDCVRRALEAAGFTPALHIRLRDIGMEKGETPPTPERVREAMEEIRRRLSEE